MEDFRKSMAHGAGSLRAALVLLVILAIPVLTEASVPKVLPGTGIAASTVSAEIVTFPLHTGLIPGVPASAPVYFRWLMLLLFFILVAFRGRSVLAYFKHRPVPAVVADQEMVQETCFHRCACCGKTEITDPDLDFRVARDGEEYCLSHLPKASKA